jgi:hypothetical protein
MSMLVGPGKEAAKGRPVADEAEPKAPEDEPGKDAPAAAAG